METTEVFEAFHTETAMLELREEKPSEGLCYETSDERWGLYPEGWRDSWYWVFTRLEHIAMDHEETAPYIREKMNALQDQICSSGETGDAAARKAWTGARELLEELDVKQP